MQNAVRKCSYVQCWGSIAYCRRTHEEVRNFLRTAFRFSCFHPRKKPI